MILPIEFSLVILAQENNPSILNRDFLIVNEIVPPSWRERINEDDVFASPPFSRVAFNNGVTIEAEQARLKFFDRAPKENAPDSPIVEIAKKYVGTLPHVRYGALGINFKSTSDIGESDAYILKRFIARDALAELPLALRSANLKFIFDIEGTRARLNLSVQPAKRIDSKFDEEKSVVLFDGNFHRECITYPAAEEISSLLAKADADWATYLDIINTLTGEKGE